MKFQKNLNLANRFLYGAVGVAAMVAAGAGVVGGLWRIALGVFGVVVFLEGAVGY